MYGIIKVFEKCIIVYGWGLPILSGSKMHITLAASHRVGGGGGGLMVGFFRRFDPSTRSTGVIHIVSASVAVIVMGVPAGNSFSCGIVALIVCPILAFVLGSVGNDTSGLTVLEGFDHHIHDAGWRCGAVGL